MSSNRRTKQDPLAIVGMGCLFPQADDVGAYWSNLKNGVDTITDIPSTHWNVRDFFDEDPKAPDHTYARRGGFLSPVDFDPLAFGIAPNDLEATDTTQLLGLMVAQQALENAGYGEKGSFDRDRASVILGVTGTLELVIPLGARLGHPLWRRALKEAGIADELADSVVDKISDGYVDWQENSFPGLLGNVVAGRIANRLDLGGTNCVVDAACASSLGALHLASLELASGRSDMVLAGGMDTFNDIFMYMCFSKTPALSPSGDCRPFDKTADGTLLGEGLGVVVLKRLADARRDGDTIHAVIRSVGSSSDGKGTAIYAPVAKGQVKALNDAYTGAGISAKSIELVEAHATGTKVGDGTEVEALATVFRESDADGKWCALGSVKSQLGHTKAAAGIAGLMKAALALEHKVLPPTLKVTEPLDVLNNGSSPFYVNSTKRPWISKADHPRRAAVSAFGFGGSNFHCVLEEADATKPSPDFDAETVLVALSADSVEELVDAAEAFPSHLRGNDLRAMAGRARSRFRHLAAHRLVLATEANQLEKCLGGALRLLTSHPDKSSWTTPDGAFYGSGAPVGSLAFLFPGQGSQYVGMLRDLSCQFPEMLDSLARAGNQLTDVIYPHPAFDDETREKQERALRATEVAQPAIGAVSVGALGVLKRFGLEPAAVAGHSYGELVALNAAEVFDAQTLGALSALRGRLMGNGNGHGNGNGNGNGNRDRGAMLAVESDVSTIESVVDEDALALVVANKNAPAQSVLSGATDEIQKAAKSFKSRGVRCTQLPVSAAFHSALVADASEPLASELGQLEMARPQRKVYANVTGETYPDEASDIAALLAGQLVKPVEFVSEIRAMHRDGARFFLEVGPGHRLTGLVQSILKDEEHVAQALDSSSGKRSGAVDLARTLARASAYGFHVDLSQWDPDSLSMVTADERAKPALTVTISGANYVKPKKKQEALAPSSAVKVTASRPTNMSSQPLEPPVQALGRAEPVAPIERKAPGPVAAVPRPASSLDRSDSDALNDALRMTQDNMAALQRMQEQTADLHRQFLHGQESVQRTLHTLVDQQQRLVEQRLGLTPSPLPQVQPELAPSPVPAPVPVPAQPVQSAMHVPEPARSPRVAETPPPAAAVPATMPPESLTPETAVPVAPAPESAVADVAPVESTAGLPPATGPSETSKPEGGVVKAALLEVVAEKTGYPADILNMDMEMDSDLGIDSIKRVEIFSALQERVPEAPTVGPEQLGTVRTLGQVVAYLSGSASGAGAAAGAAQTSVEAAPGATVSLSTSTGTEKEGGSKAEATASASVSTEDLKVSSSVLAAVSAKTGLPVDSLNLNMDLTTDLGIDHVKRAEIFSFLRDMTPSMPEVANGIINSWRTVRNVVDTLSSALEAKMAPHSPISAKSAEPELDLDEIVHKAGQGRAQPPERSILTVAALDGVAERKRIALAPDSLVWITRDDSELSSELAERMKALGYRSQLVSTDEAATLEMPPELAGLLVVGPSSPESDEFLAQSLTLLSRVSPLLRRRRSHGASIFATVSRLDGSFGLKGLGPETRPSSGGLAGLSKTANHEWPEVHCKALDVASELDDTGSVADGLVDEIFLEGPLEVGVGETGRVTLELRAGALDVGDSPFELDKDDVIVISGGARGVTAAVARELAVAFGSKLVLLGRSPEPTEEPEWSASLTAEADLKKALASRAGVAASPKRVGEDYARLMANREVRRSLLDLAEIVGPNGHVEYRAVDVRDASAVREILSDVRAKLGPITGLVHGAGVLADQLIEDKTSEQFARVYGTKAGGMTSLLDAMELDVLELVVFFSSSTARFGRKGQVDYAMANEVLNKTACQLAKRIPSARVLSVDWGPWDGGMVTPELGKLFHAEGVGLIDLKAGSRALLDEIRHGSRDAVEVVMVAPLGGGDEGQGTASRDAKLGVAFEKEIGVTQVPILKDHVLNGRAVVPMALMVEWMAHGAVHKNPGLRFIGFDELRVLKGLTLGAGESRSSRVLAGRATKHSGKQGKDDLGRYSVPVEFRSTGADGKEHYHARATIHLAPGLPQASGALLDTETDPYHRPSAEIYRELLFHGPALHGIREVEGLSSNAITARTAEAVAPSRWIADPLRNTWLADPLALDVAFQLMIVWSREIRGAASLPSFAGRYRQFREAFPADGVRIVMKIGESGTGWVRADMDFLDGDGGLVARLEDYECVVDASLNEAFSRNRLSL